MSVAERVGKAKLTLAIDRSPVSPESVEDIASNFNRTWKNVLSSVNSTVIHAFPNFQNGSRVLQTLFTRLVVYYQSFFDLWQRKFATSKPVTEPVAVQTVLMELKVMR